MDVLHAASALFVNKAGRVLLQLRDDKPGLAFAGMWTFFGGAAEDGETPEQAIYREVFEELGWRDPVLHYWTLQIRPHVAAPETCTVHNHIYVGPLTVDPAALVLGEGQAMALFGPDEAAVMELAFGQHEPLRQFFRDYAAGTLEVWR